ncbi:MAG: hypothetical protein K8I27_06040 [Planctomycetes bacterium]|nr:hypothetical protein [Planctomycetota bacterium]
MNKKLGLIVLILGVAIIALAFIDPMGMGSVGDAPSGIGSEGSMGTWTTLRVAVMAAGAVLGVWGAYGVARKEDKKK